MKSAPNWDGYRVPSESCKSATMQLQIKSTVAKCRGRWASERSVSSGAAQHKHYHGQEKMVTNSWAQHRAGELSWTQAGPAQPYLIVRPLEGVTATTGRSGFADIKSLLLCALPELKSLEKSKTPFPAPKYHSGLWVSNEQRQHSASVLRSMLHIQGRTKCNIRVPEACECREPLRLNTSHGKSKQLPHRAGSGSIQRYSCARTGWGHAEHWRGGGIAIQKQHPPAISGSCSPSSPALSAACQSPPCSASSPWRWKVGVTAPFYSWEQPGVAQPGSVLGAHPLRQDFKAFISQNFHSTLRNQPCCTSYILPTWAHVSTQGIIMQTSNCLLLYCSRNIIVMNKCHLFSPSNLFSPLTNKQKPHCPILLLRPLRNLMRLFPFSHE